MNDELNERRRLGHADGSAPPDRSSNRVMGPDSHLDDETLAGYLDDPDVLAPEERAFAEQHLAACSNCRETLADLRAVVTALSALPDIEPRRSFALTPALAGQRGALRAVSEDTSAHDAPIVMRKTNAWYERQMRAVRWATVAAAILFVFVVSADVATNRFFLTTDDRDVVVSSNQGSEQTGGSAPETLQAQEESAEQEAPAAAEATEASAEDAAGASEEMRTIIEEAPAEATPAAANGEGDTQAVPGEVEESSKDETLMFQDVPSDDDAADQAEENPRSMSTPQHYWRLAQVGLAMLIVWGLAVMIALPRIRSGNRRE